MAIDLQAGDFLGALIGYARPGSSAGTSFGSITAEPFPGFTVDFLYTTTSTDALGLVGDTVATFTTTSFTVNGNTWTLGTGSFDGTVTNYEITTSGGEFVSGVTYSIEAGGGGPVNPNITSPSTVENLINTTLSHTITASKTIASTAIIGGADASAFEISGTSTLRFASNAASASLGSLIVQVRITDTDGLTATQTITVPVKAIVFKGIKVYSRAGATSTATSSLTDFGNPLTGATGIPAAIGDTVIVIPAIGSNADRDMIITSGYTELADHYVNGTTYDANIGAFLKQLSAADTTVTFGSSGSANDAQGGVLLLFRGVDPTTPLDVALVPGGGTGTGKPDPEPITPVTVGAVGVFGGAQAAATAVNLTSSDLTAFRQVIQADTNDIAIGAGFIEWSGSGAINPAAFGGGSSNAANSWATVSFALRPAWTGGGTPSVTVSNAAQAQAATSPTLAPKQTVTPNNAGHSQAATSPTLAPKQTVAPGSASQGHSATSPSLAAASSVAPNNADHGHGASSSSIGSPVAITPADAAHGQAATEPTLAAKSNISPANASHGNAATSPTLAAKSAVAPDSASQGQASTSPSLAPSSAVAPDNSSHGQAVTSPSLAPRSTVSPADAAHGQSASQPSLAAKSAISPANAQHGQAATSPSLASAGTVAVDAAQHGQAASEPTLNAKSTVDPDSADHAQTSTSPTLSWSGQIAVNDNFHGHAATSAALTIDGIDPARPPADRHAQTHRNPSAASTEPTGRHIEADPGLRGATTQKGRRAA